MRRSLRTILVLLLVIPAAHAAADRGTPRLVALDVGEGQALLLADGSHGLLIDSGRVGMGRHVLDRLAANGVRQLDAIIYTHLHPDHAGSWFRIAEAFPRVRVIESGHRVPPGAVPDTSRWLADALDTLPSSRHRIVRGGDTWAWRGMELRVLWPDHPHGPNPNRQSLVLVIDHGDATALFMGDAGTAVEARLLARHLVPAHVDVLVAGHHGSAGTSSTRLLERAQPRYVLVSTNGDNVRGYPAEETIDRLRRHCDRLRRTWIDGEICLSLPATGAVTPCAGAD